jgi:hypothetical protein
MDLSFAVVLVILGLALISMIVPLVVVVVAAISERPRLPLQDPK